MNCNFSGGVHGTETPMRIDAQEIPYRDSFRYIDSIISKDGVIDEDVEHRIRAGW